MPVHFNKNVQSKDAAKNKGGTLILIIWYHHRHLDSLTVLSMSMFYPCLLSHLVPVGSPAQICAKKNYKCCRHAIQIHFVFIMWLNLITSQKKIPVLMTQRKLDSRGTIWDIWHLNADSFGIPAFSLPCLPMLPPNHVSPRPIYQLQNRPTPGNILSSSEPSHPFKWNFVCVCTCFSWVLQQKVPRSQIVLSIVCIWIAPLPW